MSADILNKKSLFDIFSASQETLEEALEKAKREAGAPKVERYRIGEDGDYLIRVLPLAPKLDPEGNPLPMERKGYEYPLRQLFLKIEVPAKDGKKPKSINIPVIRAVDEYVGFSVDLIDTYVKIAREKYGDDNDLMAKIKGGSYNGGLRWSYLHCIYVLDLNDNRKGPMLWACSSAQYRQLDGVRTRTWNKLKAKNPDARCPISGFADAYPVLISRGNNGGKTEYRIELDAFSGTDNLSENELQALLDAPRIDEYVYRFTRYQMEAEMEFLRQYDELHDIEICTEPDFIEAVEKLKGELPADDTSHFDLVNASSKEEDGKPDEITIDSLWNEYDAMVDSGVSERSDEYREFIEKIRAFIESNDLDMRVSRSATAKQLLEEAEELLNNAKPKKATQKDFDDQPKADEPVAKMKDEVGEPVPVVPETKHEAPETAEAPEKAELEDADVSLRPRRRRR